MSITDRPRRNGAHCGYEPLKIINEAGRSCMLEALPNPILTVARDGVIEDANGAAEAFFELGKPLLIGQSLDRLLPFGSPLTALIDQVRERGATINEYKIDLGRPGQDVDRRVDVHCAPLPEGDGLVLVMLQERTIADKIDRQLTHRGAVRSVSGLASMLAHEIKNPLSGIRGAAQLLESSLSDQDRALTRLDLRRNRPDCASCRQDGGFSDARPLQREQVNIHSVLDHVKRVAQSGFARNIRFIENHDPFAAGGFRQPRSAGASLSNLVKNAAEAVGEAVDGEIELSTAFRPGVSLRAMGEKSPIGLPLEFCVRYNGTRRSRGHRRASL